MISDIEQKKLQKLARLSFSDDEAKILSDKLGNILGMINQIHEVECENIEPLRSVSEINQRMRPDIVDVPDLSEDLFKNVPSSQANLAREIKCFVVPKVVE